jgi:hypothetical protein
MNEKSVLGRRRVRCALLLATAASIASPAPAVAANTRETCFNAYERAQRLRLDHRLLASREQLRLCLDTACPTFVKNDCGKWLGEVEASIPAVLLVKQGDQKGRTENRLAVFVDGERVAEPVDGRAIPVDPGPHDVRYELDGRFVDTHVSVPEGQKQFPLTIDLRELAPPPAPVTAPELAPWPEAADTSHTKPPSSPPWFARWPWPTYASGALAVTGLAIFAGFGIAGKSATACAPSCTHSQVDKIRTDYTVADVSLGAAIAAGAAALYFVLTAKPEARNGGATQARTAEWWIDVRPTRGGGAVAAGGSF